MPAPRPVDEPGLYSVLRLPSVLYMIAANLLVLAGAVLGGWDLFTMMLVFWLESLVIGFYAVIKMFVVEPVLVFLILPLYLAHFFFFMMVYLIAVFGAFVRGPALTSVWQLLLPLKNPAVLLGAAPLLISHGVSFYRNFWPRRAMYANKLNDISFEPYPRIMLWVPALFAAALFAQWAGGGRPVYGFPVIVLVKTCADIWSHLKANRLLPA